MASKKPKLKVISLGGLQEIGKNMTVLEYDDDIVIIDCGLAFPEDDMLGNRPCHTGYNIFDKKYGQDKGHCSYPRP